MPNGMSLGNGGPSPGKGGGMPGGMGGPGGGQPPQLNIDVDDLLDVTCDECGNDTFNKAFFIKKLSEISSPTGERQLIPVPTFECSECGNINKELNPENDE